MNKRQKEYIIEERILTLNSMENVMYALYSGAYNIWHEKVKTEFFVDILCEGYKIIARDKRKYNKYVRLYLKLTKECAFYPKF